MFRKKKQEKPINISEVKVTLKPLGKIRPGTYLTVLYAFIILCLLFAIFFLPGILAGGTYITFTTSPVAAGVWIDGEKAGVTPCEVLVKGGKRKIEFRRPFYKTVVVEQEVGSFIFALPFLPKKDKVDMEMKVEDVDGLVAWALSDYTRWCMITDYSSHYQPPPILTETVKSIRSGLSQTEKAKLELFLKRALSFTQSHFLVRHLIHAYAILETGQGVFSQGTLLKLAKDYLALTKQYENLPFWIYNSLPVYASTELEQGISPEMEIAQTKGTKYGFFEAPWFKKIRENYVLFLNSFRTQVLAGYGSHRYLNGLHFVPVPGAVYIMGKSDDYSNLADPVQTPLLPHPVKVDAFYITEDEISNRQFKVFIDENPSWKPAQKNNLIAKDLVNENYLKDWENDTYPPGSGAQPVTYVSYFAAKAYCDWLTQKTKTTAPGFVVRLPFEAEWEWACARGNSMNYPVPGSIFFKENISGPALAGSSARNIHGLRDMAGNVWEWCEDWYAPAAYLISSYEPVENNAAHTITMPYGAAKVVRGGSWADNLEEIALYTRGSQPPFFCTEITGFRVVLTER
ncbi:MAG: SUMF1/EgtB/PvdO family nonheme iron enzyme [Spirochaetales bacterium]|nr:SUMF1/EgtB/PvdO family nonheme iron enzyme [Spirochaetales bacterium]